MARTIALMALTTLGLSGAPVQEPVHAEALLSRHPVTVRNTVIASATGLMHPKGTHAHQESSRSCRSQASRCPAMPPASSTSGSAHGGRPTP
jgi:hypothetical protein